MINVLLLMILAHIIDDFVLQTTCLSQMKQESWWLNHKEYKPMYRNDYVMALLVHSMSWSIMILLPIIFLLEIPQISILTAFCINTVIHCLVDDLKANRGKLNLIQDQTIHLIQIIITWLTFVLWI